MLPKYPSRLADDNLITEEQRSRLSDIATGRVFSLYYELRTVLYLGILLLTAGLGYFCYLHISQAGHIVIILLLSSATVVCFLYALRKGPPVTLIRAIPPTPYFDYVVLLGALLMVCVQGYVQIQFGWLSDFMEYATLGTAVFLFLISYRFDHTGVLAIAITALMSFWSIALSTTKWYEADFLEVAGLENRAIVLGLSLAVAGLLLHARGIKRHFTITYLNLASLLFLSGAFVSLISDEREWFYIPLMFMGCGGLWYLALKLDSFLLLFYAAVYGYLTLTVELSRILHDPFLWYFYLLASCGGFVYFIIRYRKSFRRKA
ncbi:MAG: DUF2157 domain-containing protein [Cyclobacteriaceae bacterium]|nr:DUF2157 domain-containing protein [Cyclobacteriaceae bacterium]